MANAPTASKAAAGHNLLGVIVGPPERLPDRSPAHRDMAPVDAKVKAPHSPGCDPKLLVKVAGRLSLAHGNRGAPLLRSLAFKASCRQDDARGARRPAYS